MEIVILENKTFFFNNQLLTITHQYFFLRLLAIK